MLIKYALNKTLDRSNISSSERRLTLMVHLIKKRTSGRIIIKVAVVGAKRTTIIRDMKLNLTAHLEEAEARIRIRIRTKKEVKEAAEVVEEIIGEATVTIIKERR